MINTIQDIKLDIESLQEFQAEIKLQMKIKKIK